MQEAPEPHFNPPAKDQVTSTSGLVTAVEFLRSLWHSQSQVTSSFGRAEDGVEMLPSGSDWIHHCSQLLVQALH